MFNSKISTETPSPGFSDKNRLTEFLLFSVRSVNKKLNKPTELPFSMISANKQWNDGGKITTNIKDQC